MDYSYEKLGADGFQRLVQTLVAAEKGDHFRAMPLNQADGGRDAMSGKVVVYQVKFSDDPRRRSPVSWLSQALTGESAKVINLVKRGGLRSYVLATNVAGTGALDVGTIDKMNSVVDSLKKEWGLDMLQIWWRDDIDARFRLLPQSAKLSFANAMPNDEFAFITLGSRLGPSNRGAFPLITRVTDARAVEALFGREADSLKLSDFLAGEEPDDPSVMLLTGMPGIGKSALALRAAITNVARFTGGVLHIPFNGYDLNPQNRIEGANVVDRLINALGEKPDRRDAGHLQLQDVLRRYATDGMPVLLLFDDVSDERQIQGLIPDGGPHKVLLTSRDQLNLQLPYSHRGLSELDKAASVEVLRNRARPGSSSGEELINGENLTPYLEELATLCGNLPLALCIIGSILRHDVNTSISSLVQDMRIEKARLDALEFRDVAVRLAINQSYSRLSPDLARTFRLLSAHPGRLLSVSATASLINIDIEHVARRHLRQLGFSHLLELSDRAGAWRMHDLVRLFSTERLAESEGVSETTAAQRRLCALYESKLDSANQWLRSDEGSKNPAPASRAEALEWFEMEATNVAACCSLALANREFLTAWTLGVDLAKYLDIQSDYGSELEVSKIALEAATDLRDVGRSIIPMTNMATALAEMKDWEQAAELARESIVRSKRFGDGDQELNAKIILARIMRSTDRYDESIELLGEAEAAAVLNGDAEQRGRVLTNVGIAYLEQRRPDVAISPLEDALDLLEQGADPRTLASTLVNLGRAYGQTGRYDEALTVLDGGGSIYNSLSDSDGVGMSLLNLGNVHMAKFQTTSARSSFISYLDAFRSACYAFRASANTNMEIYCLKTYLYACTNTGLENDANWARGRLNELVLTVVQADDVPGVLRR